MNKYLSVAITLMTTLGIATTSVAYEREKPMQLLVKRNTSSIASGLKAAPGQGAIDVVTPTQKYVTVLSVRLNDRERQILSNRVVNNNKKLPNNNKLPNKVDLGMNNVPVLDQGRHGTCVTFAVTAALDAALGKGDYISQLCSLELGNYLEKRSYIYSGWDGSFAPLVLSQLMYFGIVNKDKQKASACANVAEYPLHDGKNHGKQLSLDQYKKISENLTEEVYWHHLFGGDELFDTQKNIDPMLTERVFQETKQALADGHRLTFGSFLIIPPNCLAGACATHKEAFDTWAMTKELEVIPYLVGQHLMIIYGYDDDAVAYDNRGGAHQGLFKVRNSWGSDVGDNGDFYMSYDFFKKFVLDVEKIVSLKNQNAKVN